MVVLIGAVALAWRANLQPARGPAPARLGVWRCAAAAVRGDHDLRRHRGNGCRAHSGGVSGDRVHRLTFKGVDTLNWVVHRHATNRGAVRSYGDRRVAALPPAAD